MTGIFISYRRAESLTDAYLIFKDLNKLHRYWRQVFMDTDGVSVGDRFPEKIASQLDRCNVLVVLIGSQWEHACDEAKILRLHKQDDWVRHEIRTALDRRIQVIPVLIGREKPPEKQALPNDIQSLLDIQALKFNPGQGFEQSMKKLRVAIRPHLKRPVRRSALAMVPVVGLVAWGGHWVSTQFGLPLWRLSDAVIPRPPAVERFRDCEDDACPWMVVVPAGRFMMGSPVSEPDRDKDEDPQHPVDISKVAIGQFEVTQGQWRALMGRNPSYFSGFLNGLLKGCWDSCPVEQVSWEDAQVYVEKLSAKTGQTYRLPSEAEWEYAARAGTVTAYAFGSTINAAQANFGSKTTPVGHHGANAYGLSDMHGNVWEWVQDCWHDSYHGAPSDSRAWVTACSDTRRVVRGGAWFNPPRNLRSALRNLYSPETRDQLTGLRVVRVL